MAKKCFLCDSNVSVIDFNDETFKNCSLKLAFRKKKNFKYNEVELTNASLDFVGYHTSCYKKITALGNKYSEEFNNFCTENTLKEDAENWLFYKTVGRKLTLKKDVVPRLNLKRPLNGPECTQFIIGTRKRCLSRTPSRNKRSKAMRLSHEHKIRGQFGQLEDPIDTSELLPETSGEPVLNVTTNPKLLYKGRNKDKIYCRLCLKPANKDSFKPLCDVEINYPGKSDAYKKKILEETKEIQKMLTFCIPFYNSMTFNPIICSTCLIRLKNSYQFATECLKNQQLIEKYADTYGTTERLVNINEMIETKFRNSDEANLSNIESEVCTSNVPPLPTNTTKKTNSKKYTHDSPIAKKRKTYHAPPEEDSLISSNDETSNIKVEPDEDDHSALEGLLIQGEPKREILDSDSLDSDSMIKIEPDYIDCPDFIKSEPEDNEHIENAAFNNRTGIGPDIQTNRAERHGSENVTLSRTNVSLSKRGSVFSNVDFSTEATTSDVIK